MNPTSPIKFDDNLSEVLNVTSETIIQYAKPFEPTRGLYFLLQNQEIVYIGQSINIINRITAHKADKVFNAYSTLELGNSVSPMMMSEYEAFYILKFRPLYNSTLPVNMRFVTAKVMKNNYSIGPKILKELLKRKLVTPIVFQDMLYYDMEEVCMHIEYGDS